MEAVVALGLVIVMVPTFIAVRAANKRRRLEIYRQVASRYDTASVEEGEFGGHDELLVTVRGTRIAVWCWSTRQSQGTVWRAEPARPTTAFRVVPAGLGNALFGSRAPALGYHPAFDQHFIVTAGDLPLTRRAWDADACSRMLEFLPRASLVASPGELILRERRPVRSAVRLAEGIELLADLGQRDLWGEDALRDLDGATLHPGPPPCAVVAGPADVQIGPVETDAGTRTRARCPARSLAGVPDPERISRLGACFEHADGELRLTWPGIETDARRLGGAVDLLTELSRGPSDGAFR